MATVALLTSPTDTHQPHYSPYMVMELACSVQLKGGANTLHPPSAPSASRTSVKHKVLSVVLCCSGTVTCPSSATPL
ncbi:hypothetical protein E2C01_012368 [Portunus trituberculatus]|uniref:Uncharacterized protein n=1 Tax=Portunus trituberculatus TaxID=210409 RepID=A0A5B7DDX0_PORTR|nr:hypothetical protein [Portunus trituberculatus]